MTRSQDHSESNTTQAIWVGISHMTALLVAIINAAILARYFSKSEYGTYKQVLYIYSTLLILFSAGLTGAFSYFLPRQSTEQGKDFVIRLLSVFFLLGLCFSASLYFLAPFIADLFHNPHLEKGLRLFSVIPILILPTNGLEGVYASIRKTSVIALYTTITKIFTLLLITLPVIWLKGTYITAIYGWIASSFISLFIALYLTLKPYQKSERKTSPFPMSDIFRYSLPLMTATIYGIMIRFADQYFISRYYGAEVFAEFSNGFVDLPFVGMVLGAATTVLLPLFSGYSRKEGWKDSIRQTWKSAIEKSVLLIYPLLIFFIFNSKNTVLALYGNLYLNSAVYFSIAIVVGFFDSIIFYPVMLAQGKSVLYSRIHLVQALCIWISGFIAVSLSWSPVTYAVLSRVFYMAQVFAGIWFTLKSVELLPREVLPFRIMILSAGHAAVICFAVSRLAGFLDAGPFLSLVASGIISAVLILFTGRFIGINYLPFVKSILKSVPLGA